MYKSREAHNAYYRKKQAERRSIIHRIKEATPCMDCGESYPHYVMQFDHRPDETKRFNVSLMSNRKWADIESEIAKCDLVCSNCHAARTYNRYVAEKDQAGVS